MPLGTRSLLLSPARGEAGRGGVGASGAEGAESAGPTPETRYLRARGRQEAGRGGDRECRSEDEAGGGKARGERQSAALPGEALRAPAGHGVRLEALPCAGALRTLRGREDSPGGSATTPPLPASPPLPSPPPPPPPRGDAPSEAPSMKDSASMYHPPVGAQALKDFDSGLKFSSKAEVRGWAGLWSESPLGRSPRSHDPRAAASCRLRGALASRSPAGRACPRKVRRPGSLGARGLALGGCGRTGAPPPPARVFQPAQSPVSLEVRLVPCSWGLGALSRKCAQDRGLFAQQGCLGRRGKAAAAVTLEAIPAASWAGCLSAEPCPVAPTKRLLLLGRSLEELQATKED